MGKHDSEVDTLGQLVVNLTKELLQTNRNVQTLEKRALELEKRALELEANSNIHELEKRVSELEKKQIQPSDT